MVKYAKEIAALNPIPRYFVHLWTQRVPVCAGFIDFY